MVAKPKLEDGPFIKLFEELGAQALADRIGQSKRRVYARRVSLEGKYGRQLKSPGLKYGRGNETRLADHHPARAKFTIKNGIVLVGSDWHIWPGPPSLMHRAFVKLCKELKPAAVVANGDVLDLCKISRHPPPGWDHQPEVWEEIEAGKERLHEIELAAFKARKFWSLGNHDGRFETRLATNAREYAKLNGFKLKDHFPLWEPCWSLWINDDVVVMHVGKKARQNTVWAGKTMVVGHRHRPYVEAFSDYTGTRYDVEGGIMGYPFDPQFDYMGESYRDWRSAFVVLTFVGGRLMEPSLVNVWDDNHVQFRGEIIRV